LIITGDQFTLGFQPNVADSQPGDRGYSPLWRINNVEWKQGASPKELKSETDILTAQKNGELTVSSSDAIVNCPFVYWHGGSLKERTDKTLYLIKWRMVEHKF
jgi:hypothetical protein